MGGCVAQHKNMSHFSHYFMIELCTCFALAFVSFSADTFGSITLLVSDKFWDEWKKVFSRRILNVVLGHHFAANERINEWMQTTHMMNNFLVMKIEEQKHLLNIWTIQTSTLIDLLSYFVFKMQYWDKIVSEIVYHIYVHKISFPRTTFVVFRVLRGSIAFVIEISFRLKTDECFLSSLSFEFPMRITNCAIALKLFCFIAILDSQQVILRNFPVSEHFSSDLFSDKSAGGEICFSNFSMKIL